MSRILSDAIAWKLTPSLSLAIVENGKIRYEAARGDADVEKKIPSSIETRYSIGSMGTLFLAVAIMQLEAKGKLRLEDPAARYLPREYQALDVTLRQLLPLRDGDDNYEALGNVIEYVSGVPLAIYLDRNVFGPAGMSHTLSAEPPPSVPVARGHYEWRNAFGLAQRDAQASSRKCCSFTSTAGDLARFDIALIEGKLISIASLRKMQPAFQSRRVADISIIGREGAISGYTAENVIAPAHRFAIIALANVGGFPGAPVLDRVFATFFPKAAAASSLGSVGGDPAVAARLRGLLAARAKALGAVSSLTFLSSSQSETFTEYRYLVDFNRSVKSVSFVLAADGKLDGFWING